MKKVTEHMVIAEYIYGLKGKEYTVILKQCFV